MLGVEWAIACRVLSWDHEVVAQWISAWPVILWLEACRKWWWVSPKMFPIFSICAAPDAHYLHYILQKKDSSSQKSKCNCRRLSFKKRPRDSKGFISFTCPRWVAALRSKMSHSLVFGTWYFIFMHNIAHWIYVAVQLFLSSFVLCFWSGIDVSCTIWGN